MNSAVEPSFKVTFARFRICGSREQCTRPRETQTLMQKKLYANAHLVSIWIQMVSLKVCVWHLSVGLVHYSRDPQIRVEGGGEVPP